MFEFYNLYTEKISIKKIINCFLKVLHLDAPCPRLKQLQKQAKLSEDYLNRAKLNQVINFKNFKLRFLT